MSKRKVKLSASHICFRYGEQVALADVSMPLSDFTAFIYLARLVEFGSTDQVFEAPRNARTRDCLGGAFG
jgi:hypothetical protein